MATSCRNMSKCARATYKYKYHFSECNKKIVPVVNHILLQKLIENSFIGKFNGLASNDLFPRISVQGNAFNTIVYMSDCC